MYAFATTNTQKELHSNNALMMGSDSNISYLLKWISRSVARDTKVKAWLIHSKGNKSEGKFGGWK